MTWWGWAWLGICSAALSVANLRYFARRQWRRKRKEERVYLGWSEWGTRQSPDPNYISASYDDSTYERRDAPHADDYWYAFLCTLFLVVAWPMVWGEKIRERRVKAWRRGVERKRASAELDRLTRKYTQEIVDELNNGYTNPVKKPGSDWTT